MATVVPRSKKRRTITDPEAQFQAADFANFNNDNLINNMIAHQQPPVPPTHQYPAGPSGSSSNRSSRPSTTLPSVNEVIGGKVQEVFVLEDDSPPPPANPLSAQTARGPHLANNYTYLNGNSTASSYGDRDMVDPRLPGGYGRNADGTISTNGSLKGKRKAQASPLGADAHLVPAVPHDADLIAPAPNAGQITATKRRKRSHPVQGLAPGLAGAYPPGVDPSVAGVGANKRHQLEHAQPPVEANYRGGYPAGSGALDYVARSDKLANNAGLHQRGYDDKFQGRFEGTASTRDSYASSSSYAVPPPVNQPVDDKEGHFIVRAGDYVTNRYKIISQLGQGTFGKVVQCWDRRERRYVAIKIIRAIQKYRDASQIEIRVLKTLREHDPGNDNKCIHLLDTFSFKNHVCIVSELLGKSVFDFLKENSFNPFPAQHIWSFAKQLLKSVAFLHRLNLVHTDLKPENILLVSSDHDVVTASRRQNAKRKHILTNTEIRLIDFGSATFNDEYHSAVVSTRHYRAPEIILQMGWSFPCDVWSIGCILVEFFTGDALFQTHDNLEHLAMMEAVLGEMSDDYRRKAETYKPELFRGGVLNYPNSETPKNSRKYVRQMKKLSDIIPQSSAHAKHNQRFLHLLRRLLEFDPSKRIKVSEALNHPYFDLEPRDFPP